MNAVYNIWVIGNPTYKVEGPYDRFYTAQERAHRLAYESKKYHIPVRVGTEYEQALYNHPTYQASKEKEA